MNIVLPKNSIVLFKKSISLFMVIVFASTMILPPRSAVAQIAPITDINLPMPGAMVFPTPGFEPTIIKGITIHPENPLEFDFIVDTGEKNLQGEELKAESLKLIKYFLASLTVPEEEMWVNLSPYEKDRIIPESFGQTAMGRDLLAQDYMLKQLMSSLMYPENELGEEFWSRVYKKAYEKYGKTEIPLDTFNKVWIVPDKAVLYEHDKSVFVLEKHLKVMLEEDYMAEQKSKDKEFIISDKEFRDVNNPDIKEVIREVLIPELEKEVNEGKVFANLRQIYNSMILAAWFKHNLQKSLLGQVYVNKKKIAGVDVEDKNVKYKIYEQYLEAFKKGVFDYIKEDYDPEKKAMIPRKYFSGGVTSLNYKIATVVKSGDISPVQQQETLKKIQGPRKLASLNIDLQAPPKKITKDDEAMTAGLSLESVEQKEEENVGSDDAMVTTKAQYIGVFLDEISVAKLRDWWRTNVGRPLLEEEGMHHMTVKYAPGISDFSKYNIGEATSLQVVGWADNGNIQAVLVRPKGIETQGEYPHITIAKRKGFSSVESNRLLSQGYVEVEGPVLQGRLGFYDDQRQQDMYDSSALVKMLEVSKREEVNLPVVSTTLELLSREDKPIIVYVGGGGSGKTEQLLTSIYHANKSFDLFDLRKWTIAHLLNSEVRKALLRSESLGEIGRKYIESLEARISEVSQKTEPEHIQETIAKMIKDDYLTDQTLGIKYVENLLVKEQMTGLNDGIFDDGLTESSDEDNTLKKIFSGAKDIIIFDEFDMGIKREGLTDIERETAEMIMQIVSEISKRRRVALIVHPPARQDSVFMDSLRRELSVFGREVVEVDMQFFPEDIEKRVLKDIGITEEGVVRNLLEYVKGLPSFYIDIMKIGGRAKLIEEAKEKGVETDDQEQLAEFLVQRTKEDIKKNKPIIFDRADQETRDYLKRFVSGDAETVNKVWDLTNDQEKDLYSKLIRTMYVTSVDVPGGNTLKKRIIMPKIVRETLGEILAQEDTGDKAMTAIDITTAEEAANLAVEYLLNGEFTKNNEIDLDYLVVYAYSRLSPEAKRIIRRDDILLALKASDHIEQDPVTRLYRYKKVGGIDLNPASLDMQIKKDGNGVALPVDMQNLENINIEGLIPIIINVTPIESLPIFLGVAEEGQTPGKANINNVGKQAALRPKNRIKPYFRENSQIIPDLDNFRKNKLI